MAIAKTIFGVAAIAAGAVLAAQPTSAQQSEQALEAEVAVREQATNQALLDALLERRRLTESSQGDAESRRYALDFLDSRIAQIRRRLAAGSDGRQD